VTVLSGAITDYKLEFRDLETNMTIHTGSITDASSGPGVFHLQFTPTLAGKFNLYIQFNGLDVDSSPYLVTVSPAATTDAVHSNLVNINSLTFTTGQSISFIIEARDAYGNLRTASTTDIYTVTLTGETYGTIINAPNPTPNFNGTYSAKQMFSVAEPYTLTVKLNGVNLKDTPI